MMAMVPLSQVALLWAAAAEAAWSTWWAPLAHGNCTTGPWYMIISTAPMTVQMVPATLAWLWELRSRSFSIRRTMAMMKVTAGRMLTSADEKLAEVSLLPT